MNVADAGCVVSAFAFVCDSCPKEKDVGTFCALFIFESKLMEPPLACDGCPKEKLGGADCEVLCPKRDGVGAWSVLLPKLI